MLKGHLRTPLGVLQEECFLDSAVFDSYTFETKAFSLEGQGAHNLKS